MFVNSIKALPQFWLDLEKKWLPTYVWTGNPFTLWQERILFIICFSATVFGPFALIPSIILSVSTGFVNVAVLDTIAYVSVVLVLFSRNTSFNIRAASIFCILYVLGAGLLFFLGPIGTGYLWLLGASIIISSIHDFRVVVFIFVLNICTFTLFAFFIDAGILGWGILTDKALEKWLVMAVNFLLVNALITITTVLMLHSLKETLRNEQDVRAKLQENEQRYRTLFETAKDAIFLIKDNIVIDCNPSALLMFGCGDKNELLDLNPWSLSAPQQWDGQDSKLKAQIFVDAALAGNPQHFEWTYQINDGVTIESEVVLNRLRLNKEFYLQAVARDVTEYKRIEGQKNRAEEQYRQAQKMESIGRLAGGVAHDLNNLLSPILGYSEILLDELEIEDDRRESVDLIFQAGICARDLVRQLLAFSRKQTLNVRHIDINSTISGFEKLLRRTIREDIELELTLTPDNPVVKADIGQMEQVLMNLIVNSADAMPDGGTVVIETALVDLEDGDYIKFHQGVRPGKYVMVAISDTGCGMDEETTKNIFEPFFSTKGEQGTGLGLATVYGIIKQHDGNIWVYSEPGKGTTFKVYLPVVYEVEAHVEDTMNNIESMDSRGTESIALVEDNESVRKLVQSVLRQKGYTVFVADNGEDALTMLENHAGSLGLLLTDVIMPGINGRELYNRARKKYPDLNVLYMSGYTSNVIAHHGVLEKGVQFIQKPFTVMQLLTKVREVLNQTNNLTHD